MRRPLDVPASVPVVIVGGGPTGIAAATLLAQHGVASVILERWGDIYPQPRAVAADDEVFRILARLGIGDELPRLSRPGLGLRLVTSDLAALLEFPRNPKSGVNGFPESNMFDQPELEGALRANLQAYPDVWFRRNADVTRITQDTGERLKVSFTDRVTGDEYTLESDYVLGCDGANSLTRRAIGATMRNLGFEQRWLVIDIETDAELGQWDGVHQVCSSVRAGTYMRIGETRYRWEFQLLPGESGGDYTTLPAIAPLIAPWTRRDVFERMTLLRTSEYTFRAQVADRWRYGNVFILGDSAHVTPPFIGQGMGAGLRDAMNLAWKVAGVHRGVLPESMLDSFEQERKPHVRSLIRFAVVVGWAMTAGGRLGDRMRSFLLPAASPLAAAMGAPTTPRVSRSALVRRSRRPRDLAGSLCPNPRLGDGRLDGVVGNHVALVTTHRLGARQCDQLEWCGVRVLQVPDGSELGTWLRRGRARAAVVRPDRTVLRAGRNDQQIDELCSIAVTMGRIHDRVRR